MWFSRLRAFCRRLLAPHRTERDLHDDVQAYADLLADDLATRGLPRAEANRRARATLGGIESVKEQVRGVRAGFPFEQAWRDVHYAWRGLVRAPAFSVTAILVMGLGLGVTTTIFSVADSALFKPLPYDRPHELVQIGHRLRVGTAMEVTAIGMDWTEAADWRAAQDLIHGVEAFTFGPEQRWLERDTSLRVAALTPGLPHLVGLRPVAGRMFTAEEVADGMPVVLISEGLWTTAFGRATDAIGQTMTLDGAPRSIVGVLPSAFRFGPGGGGNIQVWTGLDERSSLAQRASFLFRLRPGVTPDAARDRVARIGASIQAARPAVEPWIAALIPLDQSRREMGARLQTPMLLLLGTAGLVLLIACVNTANLLLTRGASRRPELAMRAALGASRAQLVRLLLAEGVTVAVLGGVAAVLLSLWTAGALAGLVPSRLRSGLFVVSSPVVDWRVLAFAVAATVAVVLLAAVWPALSGARVSLRAPADLVDRSVHGGRRRGTRWLQASQVALAFVLAATAALLAGSFGRMVSADLGFDPRELGSIGLALPGGPNSTRESTTLVLDEVVARVRATPGVRSAALGASPASAGSGGLVLPGAREAVAPLAIRTVGRGYLETAGIRLIAGRDFGPEDTSSAPHVALIDAVGARQVFGDDSPIGQRFTYSPYVPELTIVGVVERVAASDFASRSNRVGIFLAASQTTPPPYILVRAERDLASSLGDVRRVLAANEPGIQVQSAAAATDYYEEMETFAAPRFYLILVSVFAGLALATTSLGLYGLLAHAIGGRRREIGIRLSLGATPAGIRRLVLAEALTPVVSGLVVGGLAAWWTSDLAASLLYDTAPRDPWAFGGGALAIGVATVVAVFGPMRHAARVDPISALRVT